MYETHWRRSDVDLSCFDSEESRCRGEEKRGRDFEVTFNDHHSFPFPPFLFLPYDALGAFFSHMRLSKFALAPLRLPKTLRETLRLLPSPSPPSSSSSSSSESSPSPPSVVQGWISSLRTSKNIAFIGLNDGTLDRPLQVVVLGKKTAGGMRRSVRAQNPFLHLRSLLSFVPLLIAVRNPVEADLYPPFVRQYRRRALDRIGASLKITGPIIPSPGPGQPIELQASALEVLGSCDGEVS